MAQLIVEEGNDAGTTVDLPAYAFVLGRGSASDFVLDDPRVSRQHACIRILRGEWVVRDLGTSNGTFVDGERSDDWTVIHDGSRIRLGRTVARLSEESRRNAPAPVVDDRPTIPGHELIEEVGAGATGVVYSARNVGLDRIVAVKVLSTELAKKPKNVERFAAEARAAAALSHPHVVPVYEVGQSGGHHWFSMEYMQNGTVEDLLLADSEGGLPWREAIAHAAGAAEGLAYLHERGFVHRDVKPANLLLDAQGVVKLGDMGTVVRVEDAVAARIGTPHFMSPEQARREPVTTASDVYSLGATLYRMLSGETPHHGTSVKEIVRSVARDEPRPIEELCPQLRPEVAQLVRRLLARNPERRPKHAAEVGTRLREALEDVASSRRIERQARRRKTETSAWIVRVVLVLIVVGALWLMRDRIRQGFLGADPSTSATVPSDTPADGGDDGSRAPAGATPAEVATRVLADVREKEGALLELDSRNAGEWRRIARDYERLADVFPLNSEAVLVAHWRAKEIRDRVAEVTRGDEETLAFADRWVTRALRDAAPRRTSPAVSVASGADATSDSSGIGGTGPAAPSIPTGATLAEARDVVLAAADIRLRTGDVQGALEDVLDWVRAERMKAREADASSDVHETIAAGVQWMREAASSASARLEQDLERDRDLLRTHLPKTSVADAGDLQMALTGAIARLTELEPLMLTYLGADRVRARASHLAAARAALEEFGVATADEARTRLAAVANANTSSAGAAWLALELRRPKLAEALVLGATWSTDAERDDVVRELAALQARAQLDSGGGANVGRWLAQHAMTDTALLSAGPLTSELAVFPESEIEHYYETWGGRPPR